jgi:hypothetical protein
MFPESPACSAERRRATAVVCVLAIEPALRLLVPLPSTVGAPYLTFMSISTRPHRRGFFLRLACVSAVLNRGFHVVSLS